MLVAVHKLFHVPYASRIKTSGTIFTERHFSVSKEWLRSWSHAFLITYRKTFTKKLFGGPSRNSDEKEKKTKTRNRWRLTHLRAEPPPVSEPCISQGHMIKGSCDIIGRNPSRKAIILPSLVAIDTLLIEIWWFLFATWPCKTTWSKLCMTLWLGACEGISPS